MSLETEPLDIDETLAEIDNSLRWSDEVKSTNESMKALQAKRLAAFAKLSKPAEAREIFLNALIDAKNSFDKLTLAIDIGDTYRREGSPESYEVAEMVFQKVRKAKGAHDMMQNCIVIINMLVSEALLTFSRDSNSQPNPAGFNKLRDAAQMALNMFETKESADDNTRQKLDEFLAVDIVRNTLVRAVQFLSNYSLRMGDMATHGDFMAAEKLYGLEPKNPAERGNRLGTFAIQHFQMVTSDMDDKTKKDLLDTTIRLSAEAASAHSSARTEAGDSSAILGDLWRMKALLAKYRYGIDVEKTEGDLYNCWENMVSTINATGVRVQPDALDAVLPGILQDADELGRSDISKELRDMFALQS